MTFDDLFNKAQSNTAVIPGKKVKLDFGSSGRIFLDGVANQVTQADDPADTTVQMSFEDFSAMADGKLDPTMAFMSGKLKVLGDMGTAMQLQSLISKLR